MAHVVINGLGKFCFFIFVFVFAINSCLHAYLMLAISDFERVTIDVGFYYLSNAANRLTGKFLSGASYQFGGYYCMSCLRFHTTFIKRVV